MFCKLKMAAAAILVFGFYIRFSGFWCVLVVRVFAETFVEIDHSVQKLC